MKPFLIILFTCQVLDLSAQTERYLELKGFDAAMNAKATIQQIVPSFNKDNDRLGLSIMMSEYNSTSLRVFNIAGRILNLNNGRLEFSEKSVSIWFDNNDICMVDYSGLADKWISLGQFTSAPMYRIDPISGIRTEIKRTVPEGYYLEGSPFSKSVFLGSATGSALAVKVNGDLQIKHKFDIVHPKYSPDSTKIYGGNYIDKTIKIYNGITFELLRSIKTEEAAITVQMLKNNNLFCVFSKHELSNGMIVSSKLFGSILSSDGSTVIKDLNEIPLLNAISKNEKELLAVSQNGVIKLIDLASGNILAEEKDTYIELNSKIGAYKGAKSVGYPYTISGGEFYIIPYSTGLMSLFSVKERKVVANIYMDNIDWAVIAKDGRVDGTAGAFEKLEWREYSADKLIRKTSLESTFDKYFTPRLLYSILHSEPLATAALSISADTQNVPTLTIEKVNDQTIATGEKEVPNYNATNKNITVTIKALTNIDRISEIRLFQNGKLVGSQKAAGGSNYQFNVSLNSIIGEKNYLYAVASSANGIDSEKSKVSVNYSGVDSSKPKLYVLIVGINKYQNPRYELNYALPDAEAVKTQLQNSKSALFESVEIKSLFEGEATKTRMVQAFKDLSAIVKEQDIFIFYYAGHGTMNDLKSIQEFYIVPYDVTQLYGNEALLKSKALSASEIKQLSMGLNAQKQIFIIDACHSAGALESVATRGAAEERAIGQLARSTGTFWLTAAGSDQFATEFKDLGHGVFTYSLLEALQGKDAGSNADGTITVRELSSYVEQRVPELSQKYKGKPQYPASFSFGNDFPIMILKKN